MNTYGNRDECFLTFWAHISLEIMKKCLWKPERSSVVLQWTLPVIALQSAVWLQLALKDFSDYYRLILLGQRGTCRAVTWQISPCRCSLMTQTLCMKQEAVSEEFLTPVLFPNLHGYFLYVQRFILTVCNVYDRIEDTPSLQIEMKIVEISGPCCTTLTITRGLTHF